MLGRLVGLSVCVGVIAASPILHSAQASSSWLDRPMSSWNQATSVPVAKAGAEGQAALERRCGSGAHSTSFPGPALRAAGWAPYLHLDRATARDDIQVVGGMSAASPGCDPEVFNLFVFVAGRFAGTLSPVAMMAARDGVAGAVRITGVDALTAEFARYKPGDIECCPSSRVRVTYRVDRSGARPQVVATDARQVR